MQILILILSILLAAPAIAQNFPIRRGLLQTDLNAGGHFITNAAGITDSAGNPLAGISVAQGTNVVLVTNGTVVTINATGGGTNGSLPAGVITNGQAYVSLISPDAYDGRITFSGAAGYLAHTSGVWMLAGEGIASPLVIENNRIGTNAMSAEAHLAYLNTESANRYFYFSSVTNPFTLVGVSNCTTMIDYAVAAGSSNSTSVDGLVNQYFISRITTNTVTFVDDTPIALSTFVSISGAGSPTVTAHPEIWAYFTNDTQELVATAGDSIYSGTAIQRVNVNMTPSYSTNYPAGTRLLLKWKVTSETLNPTWNFYIGNGWDSHIAVNVGNSSIVDTSAFATTAALDEEYGLFVAPSFRSAYKVGTLTNIISVNQIYILSGGRSGTNEWAATTARPVYISTNRAAADPAITIATNGLKYMAYTTEPIAGNGTLGMAVSENWVTWTPMARLYHTNLTKTAWSPKWFLENGTNYLIYASGDYGSAQLPYAFWSTNYTNWSGPVAVSGDFTNASAAVACDAMGIVKIGSTYYCAYKSDNSPTTGVLKMAQATSLLGPYTTYATPTNGTGVAVHPEGRVFVKRGTNYVLYSDQGDSPYPFYYFTTTSDMTNFTTWTRFQTDDSWAHMTPIVLTNKTEVNHILALSSSKVRGELPFITCKNPEQAYVGFPAGVPPVSGVVFGLGRNEGIGIGKVYGGDLHLAINSSRGGGILGNGGMNALSIAQETGNVTIGGDRITANTNVASWFLGNGGGLTNLHGTNITAQTIGTNQMSAAAHSLYLNSATITGFTTTTNIYFTNGPVQNFTVSGASAFNLVDPTGTDTNLTISVRLNLIGSNTVTWQSKIAGAANLTITNVYSAFLFDWTPTATNWHGYKLR